MKNLLTFFFSFDKLFKEKLVVPTFWVALIYFALTAIIAIFDFLRLDPLNYLFGAAKFFVGLLFALLAIRILAELVVAIFRINDNLSPDKGRSELIDIDPVAEARKAAEMAAARTREVTHTATERTKSTLSDARASVADTTDTLTAKAREATMSAKERTESVMGKGSVPEPGDAPTPVKILEPTAGDLPKKRGPGRPKGSKNKPKTDEAAPVAKTASAPAKRGPGRPKGSKNKPKTDGATTAAPAKRGPGRPKGSKNKPKATGSKPGPKKGAPIPRDADGNLLKKDGTPRKKPGPKPKPAADG